jgi:hypothetical protein
VKRQPNAVCSRSASSGTTSRALVFGILADWPQTRLVGVIPLEQDDE